MKIHVAPFVAFGMLIIAMACSPSDGALGSSSDTLTAVTTATYGNVPVAADHFGTTASVAVPDTTCSGIGVDQVRTTVAWEEEHVTTTDIVQSPIWIANQCGFSTITVGNGGNARPLTTAITGGAPPEWTAFFGSQPMIYSKEPVLLPISHFDTQPWIVMVAQVGKQVGEFDSIAIALSTDGGQSWHDSHLLTDVTNFSGGGPQVDDLAATNSFREDKCDGTYECTPNAHCPTNNCNTATNDILVTWTWSSKRFFNYVSYYKNLDHVWNIAPNPPNQTSLIQRIGTKPPFTQTSENALLNMSIVAGEWSQPGAIWPFVMFEWPAQSNLSIGQEPTLQVDCTTPQGPTPIANESWHVATGYFGAGPWTSLPDSHPTTNYPLCVGSDSNGAPHAYRNDLRSSLTYDPGSHSVIDAVAIPNPSQLSAPGTVIAANAYQFNTPPGGGGVIGPTLVFESSHATTGPQEDQFLPVIKGQEFSAPATGLAIAYVDSIEDPANQNRPSGFYGANTDAFDPNNPNDLQTCSGSMTHCWWFGPTYGRIWSAAPGTLLAGPDDELGRHNSIATWSGEYFFAYGGVFNGSAIVAQTTSVWPQ